MDKKELLSECYQELFFVENHLKALSVAVKAGMDVDKAGHKGIEKIKHGGGRNLPR